MVWRAAEDREGYDDDEGSFAVIMVAKVKTAAQTEGRRAFFTQLKRQKMKQRKGAHFLGPWHAKK